MERVEMIPPPVSPGTAGDADTHRWTSSAIWKPDDPTVLYDPRFRFPLDELVALARAAARSRFSPAPRATASGRPGHVSAPREQRRPAVVADEEAALEAGWDDRVRAMVDELLKDDDDSDEAAVAPVEEQAPDGGIATVVDGAVQEAFQVCKSSTSGVQEAFQGCRSSSSSSSGGVAYQKPEPARPRRKNHRFGTNKKKKGRQ